MGEHAVVIGAGIGGLAAARALADHFAQVTVVERDRLPDRAAHRPGTPQGRHLHALLAGGLKALAALFPRFEQRLRAAGAVPLRAGLDIRVERPGFDPFPVRDTGVLSYGASRPAIELSVRDCLQDHQNVRLLQRRVTEIAFCSERNAATGVRCDAPDGAEHLLPAELVVDASGRGALTLALLASTHRSAPPETAIGVDIGYATASYDTASLPARDWLGVMTHPAAPQDCRGALMLPLEGDRCMVGLGGRGADKPPGDEAGFLDFARQLRTPTLYNAIRSARRIGDIARYAFPRSVRRHYEQTVAFPRGLLPFGDAICTFNPVYGQGMSVAAQEAVALGRVLASLAAEDDPLAGLAAAFFAELPPLLETPWAMAALPDFVYPATTGVRPPTLERDLKFGAALLRLGARDPEVHQLMAEVQHLIKPRSEYRRPALLARLLWEARFSPSPPGCASADRW